MKLLQIQPYRFWDNGLLKNVLLFLFISSFNACQNSTSPTISKISKDSSSSTIIDTLTTITSIKTSPIIAESVNAIYRQVLFGKSLVSAYRKSSVLLFFDGQHYVVNKNFEPTVEQIEGDIYTEPPVLLQLSDTCLLIKDVSYTCSSLSEKSNHLMAFVRVNDSTVLGVFIHLWLKTASDYSQKSGQDFAVKLFKNQGDAWVDSSKELPSYYKKMLKNCFKNLDYTELKGGILSFSCWNCIQLDLTSQRLRIVSIKDSTNTADLVFTWDNGLLLVQ